MLDALREKVGDEEVVKLTDLMDEYAVPEEARVQLVDILLRTKPPKKDFYLSGVYAVQRAFKIDNVFFLKFEDYALALGKGKKNVRKKAVKVKSGELRLDLAVGAEGLTFTIPWDVVREHMTTMDDGLRVDDKVQEEPEPEPVELPTEPERPALKLVEKPEEPQIDTAGDYFKYRAAASNEGESTWERILYHAHGDNPKRLADIAARSDITVDGLKKYLEDYDREYVDIEVTGDTLYLKVKI